MAANKNDLKPWGSDMTTEEQMKALLKTIDEVKDEEARGDYSFRNR